MKGFPTSSHRQFSTEGLIDDDEEDDQDNVDSQQRGIIRFQRRSPSLSVEPISCPAFSSPRLCLCVCVCVSTFQDPQHFSGPSILHECPSPLFLLIKNQQSVGTQWIKCLCQLQISLTLLEAFCSHISILIALLLQYFLPRILNAKTIAIIFNSCKSTSLIVSLIIGLRGLCASVTHHCQEPLTVKKLAWPLFTKSLFQTRLSNNHYVRTYLT